MLLCGAGGKGGFYSKVPMWVRLSSDRRILTDESEKEGQETNFMFIKN